MTFRDLMSALLTDESGAAVIEYASLASLIAVALIVALVSLSSSLSGEFSEVGAAVGAAVGPHQQMLALAVKGGGAP